MIDFTLCMYSVYMRDVIKYYQYEEVSIWTVWVWILEAWNLPTLCHLWVRAVVDMQTTVMLRTMCVECINSHHQSSSTTSYNHYRCAWIVTRIRFRSWSSHANICPICSEVIDGTIRVYVGFNLRKKAM